MNGLAEKPKRIVQLSRMLSVLALQGALVSHAPGAPQSGRPDDAKVPVPAVRRGRNKEANRRTKPQAPRFASILIKVEPLDSIVMFDNERVSPDPTNGTVSLIDLKTGAHVIAARRKGYGERSVTIDLIPGVNQPVELTLERLPATLNVSPVVDGARIDIRREGASRSLENRTGSIRNLVLPPGKYDVTVSKEEYVTETRTITLEPGQSVYLEPMLRRLAPVQERPARSPQIVESIPPTVRVTTAGKDLMITLVSASGNSAVNAGTLSVSVTRASSVAQIDGALTGFPCRIEFVRLENVAEGSVAEAPGPSNQWSRIVVRVRPKDVRRTVRFNINWTLLSSAMGSGKSVKRDRAAIVRDMRIFPPAARTT